VKRLALLLLCSLAACKSGGSPPPAPAAPAPSGAPASTASAGGSIGAATRGAAAPRGAVDAFLAAVRAQDLQAMSVIWGTEKGPARDQIDRAELEKRELIMQNYLCHDSYNILNDVIGTDGKHNIDVKLNKGKVSATTTFTTVQSSDRWYVENVKLEPVKDLCKEQPAD